MGSELSQRQPVTWRYLGSEDLISPASPYVFMLDEPVRSAAIAHDASVRIRGWAYLEDTSLMLHIVVGGREVAVTNCEIHRPGAVHQCDGKTDGRVGFDVELPPTVRLGRKIELRFTDSRGATRAVHSLSFGDSEVFRRMFLVHIPKTAGSSVNTFMEDCVGEHACTSHVEGNPGGTSILDRTLYLRMRYLSRATYIFVPYSRS